MKPSTGIGYPYERIGCRFIPPAARRRAFRSRGDGDGTADAGRSGRRDHRPPSPFKEPVISRRTIGCFNTTDAQGVGGVLVVIDDQQPWQVHDLIRHERLPVDAVGRHPVESLVASMASSSFNGSNGLIRQPEAFSWSRVLMAAASSSA